VPSTRRSPPGHRRCIMNASSIKEWRRCSISWNPLWNPSYRDLRKSK
jgi:hypothetical protein